MSAPWYEESPETARKRYLHRYLRVQLAADKRLDIHLEEAAKSAEKAIEELVSNSSAKVRIAQLNMARRALGVVMDSLYSDTRQVIEEFRKRAVEAAIEGFLEDEKSLLEIMWPTAEARRVVAESMMQTATRNVDAMVRRVLTDQPTLSRRVYLSRRLGERMVDRVINNAIGRGASWSELAKDVRSSIQPDVPGGVSHAARRLARTEINNAYHAQAINDAKGRPWIEHMRWNLSKTHNRLSGCRCERYAQQGLFGIDDVPGKPHPQCMCFVTPELPDPVTFQQNLLQGHYDSWRSQWYQDS